MSILDGTRGNNDDGHDEEDDFDDLAFENFDDRNDDTLDYEKRPFRRNTRGQKDESNVKRRLYLDRSDSLEVRVYRFINQRLGEIHPLDIAISSVDLIRECGKRRTFEGMKYAHDILDRILEEKRYFNSQRGENDELPPYAIVIPESTFEVLMYGWSNLCRKVPFAPQRMREILDLMIQEADYDAAVKLERIRQGASVPSNVNVQGQKHSDVDPAEMFANMSCQPTVAIYNTLLNGLAQAAYRSIASAGEAEDALRLMERTARRRGWHVKPNTKSFMYVINAIARTRHPSAGDRAEAVLRRMIRFHQQQLELYSEETGFEYDFDDPGNNSRRIVVPDAIAYTAVIQAHGESGAHDSAEKALRLLTEMMQSSDPNLKPDAFTYSATINAFAKRAARMKIPSARLQAAEAAEEILWLMVDTLQEVPREKLSGEAANNNPFVVPFNTCLNAWATANLKESPSRAEAILQKMLDPAMNSNSGIRPNTVSFNTCMQAWARSARMNPEAPRHAEDLLQLMERVDFVDSDVNSYTSIINAYANSTRPDKVFHARRVLEALLSNLSVMPERSKISAVPFTAVLNAVASRVGEGQGEGADAADTDPFGVKEGKLIGGDEDPYAIALKTYDEVAADLYELGISPDHLMFASMIDVIAAYTSRDSIERRQKLDQIFQDACSTGEVSAMVVQALAKACPSTELLRDMLELQTWPVESINVLPREWIRKVPPAFKKLRLRESADIRKSKSKPGKRRKSQSSPNAS